MSRGPYHFWPKRQSQLTLTPGAPKPPPPVEPLNDDDPFPFGKYGPKGTEPRKMKEVPAAYLDWLNGQDWIFKWPRVLAYIARVRKDLDQELERDERSRKHPNPNTK